VKPDSPKKLRIAVVTQYFPVREQPYRGHSAYQTLRCLSRIADVKVFAPQASYPLGLTVRTRPWSRTDVSYRPPDVDTLYFHYPAIPVLSRPVNGWNLERRLKPLIRTHEPDIILSYWIYPDGYAALRVGKKLGVPVVVKAIGSDLNCIPNRFQLQKLQYVLKHADKVLTVSDALRRKAIALGAEENQTTAILNGCDISIFHPQAKHECCQALNLPQDRKVVLYVGRLDVLKGLVELVRACAALSRSMASLHLVMVGEGPAKKVIEQLAAKLDFSSKLQLVPPASSSVIAKWMNACDVFALPSYNEGCPNVVIEALRCGRPVVATRVGGIPELVGEREGLLVEAQDEQALTQALELCLSRTWSTSEIAAAHGRSWEDVAKQVHGICENLQQRKRHHSPPHELNALQAT